MYWGRRYGRRSRARLKTYYVFCNGQFVGTSVGDNTRAALMKFCRFHGIPFTEGQSYGVCGNPARMCADNYAGIRPCGINGKCTPTYAVPSPVGLLTAGQTLLGR